MRPTICGWALQTPWSSRLVSCQLLARTVRRTPRRLRTSRATHQQGCRRTVQTVEPPSPLPGRWLLGVLGPPWLALTISQQLSQVCLHGPAGLCPVRRGRRRRTASAAVLLLGAYSCTKGCVSTQLSSGPVAVHACGCFNNPGTGSRCRIQRRFPCVVASINARFFRIYAQFFRIQWL